MSKILLMASIATMLMLADSAHAITHHVDPKDYQESSQTLEDCKKETRYGEDYCICAYRVSQGILQNGPIFNIFVQAAIKNKSQIIKLRDYTLQSDLYDEHKFSSPRDKREYLEGKFAMFTQRLRNQCVSSGKPIKLS